MNDRPALPDPSVGARGLAPAGRRRLRPPPLSMAAWRQFYRVARPYWQGDQRRAAWAMLAVLVLLMVAETQLAVMLNTQSGELMSALASHDAPRFWDAVKACLVVLAFAVPIYAFYYFARDAFANRWRRWLTGRFLDGYLAERRYYTLGRGGQIDNPDQRISEDINTFTGRSIHFLLIFVGALIQLAAFSVVLWTISRTLVGFLAGYAVVGTTLALYVFGNPLILLNFLQIKREADFRFGLMRLRENAESIAFYRGEAPERQALDRQFGAVFDNYERLIRKQRALNLFQRGFSQLTIVVPSVILAGDVLSGDMEVGRAVQAGGAFAAVLLAVSLIVDNFESLSRFVAGIDRLDALARGVLAPDDETPVPGIELHEGPVLRLEGLNLDVPGSRRRLIAGLDLQVEPGQGLLITGPSGCGKSSLLRALAGLWCSGSGVIQHPPWQEVLFLPQQPYLQPGTLRSQLVYPSTACALGDDALQEILREVQLGDLAARVGGLDTPQDWEKLLSVGEQQRLAFARVLVHRPRWLILDEATSALDSANEARLYQRLIDTGATLISIAHRPAVLRFHTQVLALDGLGTWQLVSANGYRFEGVPT